MQNSTSYASVIEAQEAGKVQIAEYGPFSYYIAVNQGVKLENIGIDITAPNTNGGYYSWGVVNPKLTPTITSVKDFKGKKVCFSDPSSTSGYLYPTYGLLQAGINPSTGVTPVFSGSDTATAVAVAKGECQVGYTNSINEPDAVAQHQLNPKDVKIVWRSPEIPGSPDAVSMSLPASLRSALKTLFDTEANSTYLAKHGYCKTEAACTLIMGQWGYASPAGWSTKPIKKVCTLTKSPACTTA
jgi:phosphonate transport system substrate-binding protein